VRSGDDRRLAAAIIADGSARSVQLTDKGLAVEAVDFQRFTWLLPQVARDSGVRLWEVSPSDESLESVFSYLVGK
jgi:ABC-2 type transport system ATP-binding protein